MISRGYFCWLVAVVAMVLASAQIGLKAEALDDELRAVRAAQEAERDRIRVLRASYAHLTAPDQLWPLVARHLELAPVRGDQIVKMADLPKRQPKLRPGSEPRISPDVDLSPRVRAWPHEPRIPPSNPPWLKADNDLRLQPVSLTRQNKVIRND